MTNKLEISRELACPFCGSNKLKHVTDDGIHFTQCKSCEATGPTGFKRGEDDAVDWNTRAAPVVERQPEPEAFMYQHDETGHIGFVDIQQVEWGFEKNNPRLKIICPLYRSPPAPVAVVLPDPEQLFETIAGALGEAMDCIRVWSAWGVGTMSENDFALVADDQERLHEIAVAVIDKVKELNQ